MFDKELNYFITHQDDLIKQYGGRVLLIKDEDVISTHDSLLDAYLEAQKNGQLGEVMIQNCVPCKDAYTVDITGNKLFLYTL